MTNKIVVDTCVFMENLDKVKEFMLVSDVVICSTVADELDKHKESRNSSKAYKARRALRLISANEDKFVFTNSDFGKDSPDLNIITMTQKLGCEIATLDRGMWIRAKAIGIKVITVEERNVKNYTGYREIFIDFDCEEESKDYAYLLENPHENIYDCHINEYLIFKDTSRPVYNADGDIVNYEVADKRKWDGESFITARGRNVNNSFVGKVKPRNLQQEILFDIMQDDSYKIKLTSGEYGTGKDYCMLANAMEFIDKGKFDKIVWLRNPVPVRGVERVGFLPGDFIEKNSDYYAVLDDVLGDRYGTEMFMQSKKLEIGNLGAIRGRTYENSIIYLTEVQNCSVEIVQLVLSRVGEGSILVLNGDARQIDDVRHDNSTIEQIIETLIGVPEFAFVKLEKVERSKIADLARLFDK